MPPRANAILGIDTQRISQCEDMRAMGSSRPDRRPRFQIILLE